MCLPRSKSFKNSCHQRILTRNLAQISMHWSHCRRNWSSCKGHLKLWQMARMLLLDYSFAAEESLRCVQISGSVRRVSLSTPESTKSALSVQHRGQQEHRSL